MLKFPLNFGVHIDKSLLGSTLTSQSVILELNHRIDELPRIIQLDGFTIVHDLIFKDVTSNPKFSYDRPGHYLIALNAGSSLEINIRTDRNIHISLPTAISQNIQNASNIILQLLHNMLKVESRQIVDHLGRTSPLTVKYSPEFKLVFQLINGNSDNQIYYWEIGQLMADNRFGRFVDRLANFTRLSMTAQIHEYGNLNFVPHNINNGSEYHVSADQLPILVNTADWQLTSPTAKIPELSFILYIPSERFQPLYIMKDDNTTRQTLNSIIMPRAGGMVVLSEVESNVLTIEDILSHVGSIWLQQLRLLLGIENILHSEALKVDLKRIFNLNANVEYIQSTSSGMTDFEYDTLLRVRTAENAFNTVASLRSLERMLDKLENMVVGDHIQVMITDSLKYLQKATMLLDETTVDYDKVFVATKLAFIKAEKAFFDPTMTSMLYFPSEHLVAVYLPFFFPVLVPYISSYFKYFKEKRTAAEIIQ